MIDITLAYRYTYREEPRSMLVQYLDGAVSVTDHNGDLHSLTYDAEGATLTGPGQLADTHRRAIAGLLATAIAQVEATLAWATP
jgi:hypothetical protein